jgi:hypothetical protein
MRLTSAHAVLACFSLAAAPGAQATSFGSGCAGASGIMPTISSTTPVFGQTVNLTMTGPPSTPGVVIAGFSDTTWQFLPLPLDLFFLPAPGCNLYVSVDVQVAIATDGSGVFQGSSGSGPLGSTVYLQVFFLDPGPSTLGGLSAGLELKTLPQGGSGQLVITEYMKDPAFVSDSAGEWFEVLNPGATAIDIEGWTIADDGTNSHVIANGGLGVIVPAGGYFTLGANGDPATNGNVTIDYVWAGGSFVLGNGDDEIVILDSALLTVDRVMYDDSVFPDTKGASAQLDPSFLDVVSNDDGTLWSDATCTIAGGPICNPDRGTPRQANDLCTTSPCPPPVVVEVGDVIVTEFLQNPGGGVADADGEWFEVWNRTAGPIDIEGWAIRDDGSDFHVIDVAGAGLTIAPGGRLVLGRNGDTGVNGGVTLDYVYGGITLSNGDDEIELVDKLGKIQDRVAYDGGPAFPDPNGASTSFDPSAVQDAVANNAGSNWCVSTSLFGDGTNLGTPGLGNDTCP